MESFIFKGEKSVIVIGGCGSLGSAVVELFVKKSWLALIIDHNPLSNSQINTNIANSSLVQSILINNSFDYDIENTVYSKIEKFMSEKSLVAFNAVINCAGGFDYSDVINSDFISKGRILMEKNYISALLCANLACKYLTKESLVIFTGSAKVFKDSCPELLLYQTTKTTTHSVALTLKDYKDLPEDCCIITILP